MSADRLDGRLCSLPGVWSGVVLVTESAPDTHGPQEQADPPALAAGCTALVSDDNDECGGYVVADALTTAGKWEPRCGRHCCDYPDGRIRKRQAAPLSEVHPDWPHFPAVTRLKAGGWAVFCSGCSERAGDYVNPCEVFPTRDWPAPVLHESVEQS